MRTHTGALTHVHANSFVGYAGQAVPSSYRHYCHGAILLRTRVCDHLVALEHKPQEQRLTATHTSWMQQQVCAMPTKQQRTWPPQGCSCKATAIASKAARPSPPLTPVSRVVDLVRDESRIHHTHTDSSCVSGRLPTTPPKAAAIAEAPPPACPCC